MYVIKNVPNIEEYYTKYCGVMYEVFSIFILNVQYNFFNIAALAVKYIGENAFYNCEVFVAVNFPEVTGIAQMLLVSHPPMLWNLGPSG